MMKVNWTYLKDIHPSVINAAYYPFQANEMNGPRKCYTHVFFYIKSGKGKVKIDGKIYSAQSGDMFYIEPGVEHTFYAYDIDLMVTVSLYVDFQPSMQIYYERGNNKLVNYDFKTFDSTRCVSLVHFLDGIELPPKMNLPSHSSWMNNVYNIVDRIGSEEFGIENELRAAFEGFFISYIRYFKNPHNIDDPRVQKVKQWMENDLSTPISIMDWAERLSISSSYLYELFRKATGCSPQHFWMQLKMDRAKKYLRETNMTITEIATILGFSSIHYFARQFKKLCEETCSDYRKRMRRLY